MSDEGRRVLDFYETPPWQTRALLERTDITGTILEPCAGDKAIVRVLNELDFGRKVYTNDIDTSRDTHFHGDATLAEVWGNMVNMCGPIDWVVTNPPFSCALPILQHAMWAARVGVAMLLRVSFPEPTRARGPWLAENPPDVIGYLPRWSYKQNGGSDSATTAWMLWFNDAVERAKYRNWVHPTKPARPRSHQARNGVRLSRSGPATVAA